MACECQIPAKMISGILPPQLLARDRSSTKPNARIALSNIALLPFGPLRPQSHFIFKSMIVRSAKVMLKPAIPIRLKYTRHSLSLLIKTC